MLPEQQLQSQHQRMCHASQATTVLLQFLLLAVQALILMHGHQAAEQAQRALTYQMATIQLLLQMQMAVQQLQQLQSHNRRRFH
jgi:cytochrome bd-type quinol oxidase subunit 1